jgi:diphthamide biosynthesis enzyme Dph1/Dph2-like protein
MRDKPIEDLEENYDLELERALKEIKKQKAKRVLLQFPDFFKPYATAIVSKLEQESKPRPEFFIYFGSCFGACDTPAKEAEQIKADLIIQWGHSAWDFKNKDIRAN